MILLFILHQPVTTLLPNITSLSPETDYVFFITYKLVKLSSFSVQAFLFMSDLRVTKNCGWSFK